MLFVSSFSLLLILSFLSRPLLCIVSTQAHPDGSLGCPWLVFPGLASFPSLVLLPLLFPVSPSSLVCPFISVPASLLVQPLTV